jgi:hypothetical protein
MVTQAQIVRHLVDESIKQWHVLKREHSRPIWALRRAAERNKKIRVNGGGHGRERKI